MKPELSNLFTEHKKPKHCCRDHVCAGLEPVDELVATVRKQVMEYQLHVSKIERAYPGGDPIDGRLEHMHQTFGALEREAQNLALASRNLAKAMRQLDAYMAEAEAELNKKAAEEVPSVQ